MESKPSYNELAAENEQLRLRVKELEARLEKYEPRATVAVPLMLMSLEDKVALFRKRFAGREDVFARRWYSVTSGKSGYQPVCLNEWRNGVCDKKKYKCAECPNREIKSLNYDDVYRHLEGRDLNGKDVIGLYPIREDNTVSFLCVDFDDKNCAHGYKDDVLAFTDVAKDWQIPCYVERSRSGNGAHVWIFFSDPIKAVDARSLGNAILSEAMNCRGKMSFKSFDRMFPNQDEVEKGGFGNLVALPLQGQARRNGNSVFVDTEFNPIPDQWRYLNEMESVSQSQLAELLKAHVKDAFIGQLSTSSEAKPWETPEPPVFTKGDFPKVVNIVRANMLYIPLDRISGKVVTFLKRVASFRNPKFYQNRAMKISNHNVPSIITCAEVLDEYIAMPRGCEDAVCHFLDNNGIEYRIDDKTNPGSQINVTFKGQLRSEQKDAVNALLQNSNGILHATTAFGKTVAAIGLIAERKVNTLILVERKPLLNQWRERLEQFLEIEYAESEEPKRRGRKKKFSPFGSIDSTGNSLHGKVDIALMQSCFEENGTKVKDFVRNYGMVIVDECHHVSSATFEQVVKNVNARYVYGLTATPTRKDGHQPIIYMQCGKIRYAADAKQQIAAQDFSRVLVPRFTTSRNHSGDKLNYAQLQRELADDEVRNKLIVDDTIKTLNDNRSPIVLTSLIEHVATLSEMIIRQAPNVRIVALIGSERAKEKREKLTMLQSLSPDEKLIVVATGKYVGEGFDLARLDTLMLAMPVSWKGLIAQYAGRLHREYEGKKEVRIYDYIDIHISLADLMYRRRLKGYAEVGYSIQVNDLFSIHQPQSIFDSTTYFEAYLADIKNAAKSIIVSMPKIWLPKFAPMLEVLQEKMHSGINIAVYTAEETAQTSRLSSLGIRVITTSKATLHSAIIDTNTVWYGEVNYLANVRNEEYAVRIYNHDLANEILDNICARGPLG